MRAHGEELSGEVVQKPRARKEDADHQTTSPTVADRAMVDRAAAKVGEMLVLADSRVKIRVDDETERVVVKVVEQESGEVIRQIPPEELLELEKYLSSPRGLLLHEQV